jgi:hypothetical protein
MKKPLIQMLLVLAACCARGQGTFVYDQQSYSVQNTPAGINSIQPEQPMGQSFVPSLSSIGFISLYLSDQTAGGSGSTVEVNLWSGSIGTGTLLGSTASIFIPHGYFNYTNFLFLTPVTLTSGGTYYFQPLIQSGDSDQNMTTGVTGGNAYINGSAIFNGATSSGFDLLFREGVVATPEPPASLLALLGIGGICFFHRRNR